MSNLYITKTVYATFIAMFIGLSGWPYPFLPRHLTVVSTLAIGVPSFVLALAPNPRRYVPGFVLRVVRFTVPSGAVIAVAAVSAYGVARHVDSVTVREARTCATIVLLGASLWVLVLLARPFTRGRTVLVLVMATGFVGALTVPPLRDFYELDVPSAGAPRLATAIAVLGAVVALELSRRWFPDRFARSGSAGPE